MASSATASGAFSQRPLEGAISLILVRGDRGYSAVAMRAARTLVRHYTEALGSSRTKRRYVHRRPSRNALAS